MSAQDKSPTWLTSDVQRLGVRARPGLNLESAGVQAGGVLRDAIAHAQRYRNIRSARDGLYFVDGREKHLANELVIADDSGLEVTALGRAPGVHSARFAQSDANPKPSDADNNYKLLHELSQIPGADRAARFVCVIAAARDGKILQTFRGEAWGEILPTPIGRNGFGYDPIFLYPPYGSTLAEVTDDAKLAVAHRGQAFRALASWLATLPTVC